MCGDLTSQLGLIKASKRGLRLRPQTKQVQCSLISGIAFFLAL